MLKLIQDPKKYPKKAKKAAIAMRIVEQVASKKANTVTVKLKQAEIAKKLAIKKNVIKAEVDIKKVKDQAAKNLQTALKKL